MQSVTSAWLCERGGLHDARVLDVRTVGSNLEISFDDEWVNERGIGQPEGEAAPGTLVLVGFPDTEYAPNAATGGWISEVALRGNLLDLVFCDRPPLSVRVDAVWWRRAV